VFNFQFTHNLCSVTAIAREGYMLNFKNGAGQFMRGGVKVLQFTIQRAGNLYFTDITRVEPLHMTAAMHTRRTEILALQAANPFTGDPSQRVPIASVGGRAPTCTNCMGCNRVTNSCWDQHLGQFSGTQECQKSSCCSSGKAAICNVHSSTRSLTVSRGIKDSAVVS
jgi:hypothetical protein